MDAEFLEAIIEMRAIVLHRIAVRFDGAVTLAEVRSLARRMNDSEVLASLKRNEPALGWIRSLFSFGTAAR